MPRVKPLSENAKKDQERMKQLRLSLGLTVPHCCLILGMSQNALLGRENGLTPWREEQIRSAKTALQNHVYRCAELIRTTL